VLDIRGGDANVRLMTSKSSSRAVRAGSSAGAAAGAVVRSLSRRAFLKNTAAGAVATGGLLLLPSGFLRGADAPSNRINVACVGVNNQGWSDSHGVANAGGHIAALVDVDANSLATSAKSFAKNNPRTFRDYREMLDKCGKDIDAVTVSTPDHTHFAVAYAAAALGKHIYVQKPLCHTADQVHRLAAVCRARGVIAQMGNQGASSAHTRLAREYYEAGLLGDVTEVDAWTVAATAWPQGVDDFQPPAPAPKHLDWDLWLGPASAMDYRRGLHPFTWRGYFKFGCGALGDMAIHLMFDPYIVLGLTSPTKIEVNSTGAGKVSYPKSSTVIFHFPAANGRGPVRLTWNDGGRRPAPLDFPNAPKLGGNGSLLRGSKFALTACGWNGHFEAYGPNAKGVKKPAEKYPRIKGGHYRNWIDAIRAGSPATLSSPITGICEPFAEVVMLGCIAQRLGRTLNWDAAAGAFTGDAEANALLKAPAPRAGFLA